MSGNSPAPANDRKQAPANQNQPDNREAADPAMPPKLPSLDAVRAAKEAEEQRNQFQDNNKGIGNQQAVKQQGEFYSVDDSIKQRGNPDDAGRDNQTIAREDYGIEVTRANGKTTLSFPKQNIEYPITDNTAQIGVHRPSLLEAQVNVVDEIKDGVISIDRISVNPIGKHTVLDSMKWKISPAGNPEQTIDALAKAGIKLEPEYSRIKIEDSRGGHNLTLDQTTGELSISYNPKSGIISIENINLPGEDGSTLHSGEGKRVAQTVLIDTNNDNAISVGKEYHVNANGERIAAKSNFDIHDSTAENVRTDVSRNANPLAELEPGKVYKSPAGIEWKKDNEGNLYYNTNGNAVWGRLDREQAYTQGPAGRMVMIPDQQVWGAGFAEAIVGERPKEDRQLRVKPHSFDLNVSEGEKVAEIFNHGFQAAQDYANQHGYVLGYKPSGIREKSIAAAQPIDVSKMQSLNALSRIELQEVWAQRMIDGKPAGEAIKLGLVRIQDETHLTGPIASPEKIAGDIHSLMKDKIDIP